MAYIGKNSFRLGQPFGTPDGTKFLRDDLTWETPSANASGGGSDQIFWKNGQTVTTNYSVPASTNAMSAGPTITINSGVTVTVPSGSYWTVI